jgi:hypothetical protein
MLNIPKIHINRRFKIHLDKIIKIVQKKHGSIYVYYKDDKYERPKIAIAKSDINHLVTVINTYKVMRGEQLILVVYE